MQNIKSITNNNNKTFHSLWSSQPENFTHQSINNTVRKTSVIKKKHTMFKLYEETRYLVLIIDSKMK